jgi:uncharacterized protein (DUF952 family)
LPDEWRAFDGKSYEHSSLASEGFIHCSFEEQIDAVLKRYFSGHEKVVIIAVDPAKLNSKLIVEPSTGGENYPHIYGPINSDAIVSVTERLIA